MKNILYTGKLAAIAFSFAILLQGCFSTVYVPVESRPTPPPPPAWAPEYDDVNHVRYYYIPDMEVYYDVWSREYVYLHDGHWIFAAELPHAYAAFDINNSFVIVLDRKVFEPWRSHHVYISHYPRYYYRTRYRDHYHDNDYSSLRGYNENAKRVINNGRRTDNFRQNEEIRRESAPTRRTQAAPESNRKTNDNAVNESQNRRGENNGSNPETRRRSTDNSNDNQNNSGQVKSERRSQPAEYKGNDVGKPVKVSRSMRQPKQKEATTKTERKQESSGKSSNSKPRRR